jgi:hypothetical protein
MVGLGDGGSLPYPTYARTLVSGFRSYSWWLAVSASPSWVGLGRGALMAAVNRTNPVNGNLPLTGLIRSTAFHDHPNTEQVNGLPFPFPTPLQKLVGLFFTSVSHPALFLVYAQEERLVQGLWWLCCVCCAPPQGTRPPWSQLGVPRHRRASAPPGCHWHCPVKRGRREKGPAFRSLREQLSGRREPLVVHVLAWLSRLGWQKGPHEVPHAPQ